MVIRSSPTPICSIDFQKSLCPKSDRLLAGNTLYGTAEIGGSSGSGTVFSLSLPSPALPALKIIRSAHVLVISWPASVSNAVLESKSSLSSGSIWTPVQTAPVLISDQNVVTVTPTNAAKFYRLRSS
jgi:uncharacterized repeat protein (TIGR03803 family)